MPTKEVLKEIKPDAAITDAAIVTETTQFPVIEASRQEIEAYKQMQVLQQRISESWKPPRGLVKGIECLVGCLVDGSGKAHTIKVEKSSGVLMFDVAAKKAVATLEFPLWARGSNITIVFKS